MYYDLKNDVPNDFRLFSILTILFLGAILITSQHSAYAGFIDHDQDGYQFLGTCGPDSHPTCDPDDNDPCNPDHHSSACVPMIQVIQNLMDDIVDLIDEGEFDINSGQTNSLLGKLQSAIEKLESDNTNAAINKLNAFINQLNAFINSDAISFDDGQSLISEAKSIIGKL